MIHPDAVYSWASLKETKIDINPVIRAYDEGRLTGIQVGRGLVFKGSEVIAILEQLPRVTKTQMAAKYAGGDRSKIHPRRKRGVPG